MTHTTREIEKQKNSNLFSILLGIIIILFFGLILYLYIFENDLKEIISKNNNCNLNINKTKLENSNIQEVCKKNGYDGGWGGCSQSMTAFTCYKKVLTKDGELTKYTCFEIEELLK